MRKRPLFICISGIDGVGKTTHVNLVLDYFRSQGIRCSYKWMRFHHLLSLPVLVYCRVRGYTRRSSSGKYNFSYHEFWRSRFISLIYPWTLYIDTMIVAIFKIYLPILFGTTIVCDRFVYDTLIDLSLATRDKEIYNRIVGKLFLKLLPNDARIVVITLDKPTILFRRSELRFDDLFDERYSLYQAYTRQFSIACVENDGEVQKVNTTIRSYLVI